MYLLLNKFFLIFVILFLIICFNVNNLYAEILNNNNIVIQDNNTISNNKYVYKNDKIDANCQVDNKNLSVHIIINDRSFQMQIINFGLVILIGSKSIDNNIITIEYPVVQNVPPPPPNMDRQSLSETEKEEMQINFKKRTDFLLFVNNGVRKVVTLINNNEFIATIATSPEKLIYDIKVPIKYIKKAKHGNMVSSVDVLIKTPIINYKELKNKFGIPKEDRNNGNNPPANSKYKPSEFNIENLNIKISNIKIP